MATNSALSADDRGVIVRCAQCDKPNRVPFSRLNAEGHCAQCKAPLPRVAQPVEISSGASFRTLVAQSPLPVLVDFWAPWCGPCQMVAPEVSKVAAGSGGELVVAKVNTEEVPDVAGAFGIRSIPTFVVFANGRELERMAGAAPAAQLRSFALRSSSGATR